MNYRSFYVSESDVEKAVLQILGTIDLSVPWAFIENQSSGHGQLLGQCCFVEKICLVMLTVKLCTRGLIDTLVVLFPIFV